MNKTYLKRIKRPAALRHVVPDSVNIETFVSAGKADDHGFRVTQHPQAGYRSHPICHPLRAFKYRLMPESAA
jgi:hypothetical protein